jgi:hypothetical protein
VVEPIKRIITLQDDTEIQKYIIGSTLYIINNYMTNAYIHDVISQRMISILREVNFEEK